MRVEQPAEKFRELCVTRIVMAKISQRSGCKPRRGELRREVGLAVVLPLCSPRAEPSSITDTDARRSASVVS